MLLALLMFLGTVSYMINITTLMTSHTEDNGTIKLDVNLEI